ncbi:MAG: sialate O-acetylesterase [Myxococcota bacterium]
MTHGSTAASLENNLDTELPAYDGEPYRLEGIAWHQGWNDRIDEALNEEYESNAVHFVNDLRAEFEIPDLPFVLATTGMAGWAESHPRALSLMEAQLAVPGNPGLLEPTGVGAVDTRSFWQPADESPADAGYLWNRNALTHLQIGAGLAEQMVEFVPGCEESL